MDEQDFQKRCDAAFESLLRRLQEVGDERGFEVEGGSGKLEVLFEDAEETRFVISPNTPVRQIWISALTTSFKLSWSDAAGTFVLDKTGETLMQLMGHSKIQTTLEYVQISSQDVFQQYARAVAQQIRRIPAAQS